MAQFFFECLLLGLANASIGLAMATNKPQIMIQPISLAPSNAPAESSPSSGQRTHRAEPPIMRKIGRHHQIEHVRSHGTSPTPSPSEAPQSEKKLHSGSTEGIIPSHQRTSVEPHSEVLGSQEKLHLLKHHHHHSFDKSIAGAGAILGGLATTFLVAVFCYVRATRRHKQDASAYSA